MDRLPAVKVTEVEQSETVKLQIQNDELIQVTATTLNSSRKYSKKLWFSFYAFVLGDVINISILPQNFGQVHQWDFAVQSPVFIQFDV